MSEADEKNLQPIEFEIPGARIDFYDGVPGYRSFFPRYEEFMFSYVDGSKIKHTTLTRLRRHGHTEVLFKFKDGKMTVKCTGNVFGFLSTKRRSVLKVLRLYLLIRR